MATAALMILVVQATAIADDRPIPGSVYQVRPVWDGAIIASSVLAVSIPYVLSSRLITPTCPCRADSVNVFDRGVIGRSSDNADWVSTLTVGLTVVGPPLLDWVALPSKMMLAEDLTVFFEAIAVNSALVTGVKYAVQRPIPRVYSQAGAATNPRNYQSFYSGHTSTAFAALTVVSITADRRYGWSWETWALTTAVGASVAVERVLAGRHFYSDVIVGAAAGTAVGSAVSLLHLRHAGMEVGAGPPGTMGLAVSGSL